MSNRRSVNQKPAPKKGKGGPFKGPGPFRPTIKLPRQLPPGHVPEEERPAAPARKPLEPITTLAPVLAATEKFAETSNPGLLQQVGREADEALAIGKRVLGMLNVESKGASYTALAVAVDYSGVSYQPMASIAQGSTDATRDGDSLKFKRWQGHLQFTRGGVDAVVAYALVQEGPAFLVSGVAPYVFQGAGTAGAPLSEPLWDARLGFKVLARHTFTLTNSDPYKIVNFDHHFNHDVQYYNGTTTVYEGQVTLVFISNITGATAPTISFATNYSWVDN